VDLRTGVPLFDPTVYTMTEFRGRNRASATIEQVLRALKVFVLFCEQYQINLGERMQRGQLLELGELDALVQICRLPLADVELHANASSTESRPVTASLETYRARAKKSAREVAGDSAGIRIRYIRQFVNWLTDKCLLSLSAQHPSRARLLSTKEIVISAFDARVPTGKGRNKSNNRKALDKDMQDRLWEIIDVNSAENPWVGRHTRIRNELIVRWFMGLGIRRGELLGVTVRNVNFRANEVFIARRADDKGDPRGVQPNAKTLDRFLPISDDLSRRTREYILDERSRYPAAGRHPFLLVANGGRPLSLRGLNEISIVLREKHPDLPIIFPHLCRHTHNFNFSEIADELGIDPEREKKTRSQIMGWSETSKSAETYTRREIERKARDASLKIRNKMMKPINDDSK